MKYNFNNLKAFALKQIKCFGAVELKIFDGESDYVEIFCSDRDFKKLQILTNDDDIVISAHTFATLDKLSIEVSAKALEKICLSGAVKADCSKTAEDCHLSLSGSISLDMYSTDTNALTIRGAGSIKLNLDGTFNILDITSAGSLKADLKGTANDTTIKTSGSSNVDGENCQFNFVTIDSSGSSKYELNVSESLAISLSGSAKLTYKGDPHIKTVKMAGAIIVKKE